MKKITKIFASVLALSMAMSTVVMPITAEAATTYIDYSFTDAADATTLTSTTWVASPTGKHTTDMVGKVSGTTNANGWGAWYTDSIITTEAQVYVPSGKIEIYAGSNQSGEDRPGVAVRNGKAGYVNANGWDYTDDDENSTAVACDNNVWHKVAFEQNPSAKTVKVYLDGVLIQTIENVKFNANGICKDIRIQNDGYIDNFRVYADSYDPANDIMPAEDNDSYTFLADSMTVAEAKAMLMANQNAETAVARVYKGDVGGTEAEDTELLQAGWNVVVTSLSGDFYHNNNVHTVVKSIETAATLSDGTLTATVTKLTDNVIPSMIMVLVQNNGQVVKASETKTNVGLGVTTFTISDVGTSLVNPQILFINTWDELAPALAEMTSVTQ